MKKSIILLLTAEYAGYMARELEIEAKFDLNEISKVEMPDERESFTVELDLSYPYELIDNVYKTVENLDIQESEHNERVDMYNEQITDQVDDVREEYFVQKDSNDWTGH